jgi:hypothetical protein
MHVMFILNDVHNRSCDDVSSGRVNSDRRAVYSWSLSSGGDTSISASNCLDPMCSCRCVPFCGDDDERSLCVDRGLKTYSGSESISHYPNSTSSVERQNTSMTPTSTGEDDASVIDTNPKKGN